MSVETDRECGILSRIADQYQASTETKKLFFFSGMKDENNSRDDNVGLDRPQGKCTAVISRLV